VISGHGHGLSVVVDRDWFAHHQRVRGLSRLDLDPQLRALAKAETERDPGERLREARAEAERPTVVAQPTEPGHRGDARPRERSDVNAVAGVVLEVVEVEQRGLEE
jgi:hypothetical protein